MQLKRKILTKKAIIGVVGLGYVGLPLILNAKAKGFITYGFDSDKKKILNLKKNLSPISDLNKKDLKN